MDTTPQSPSPIPPFNTGKGSTNPPENGESSMLAALLKQSEHTGSSGGDSSAAGISPPGASGTANSPLHEKKRMDTVTFFRLGGAILLTILIFFGSFLAYIVFNPDKARFFLLFNIQLADVQTLLAGLVNSIFGFVVVLLAIVWIILLFRAIWTPRTLKKKKTLSILGSIFIGTLLFSMIGLWAILITRIHATDYGNLEGSIILLDNDLRKIPVFAGEAPITDKDIQTLIGPITIYFDISANARRVSASRLMTIDRYEINFDGAKCTSGNSDVTGTNPSNAVIICTFDTVREYIPKGFYQGTDRATGEQVSVDMALPQLKVIGLVKQSRSLNIEGKPIYTLDASSLRSLGTPSWILPNGKDSKYPFLNATQKSTPSITEVVEKEQKSFCLAFEGYPGCRIFVVGEPINTNKNGSITALQDPNDPRSFLFTLTGITTNMNEITSIEWRVNNSSTICVNENSFRCTHRFVTYGSYTVSVFLRTVTGEEEEFRTQIFSEELIELLKHIRVIAPNGDTLNTSETFDRAKGSYILRNLTIPTTLVFDARDVIPTDPGYTLETVTWSILHGKTIEKRTGERMSLDITQEGRYEIDGEYSFVKKDGTLSGKIRSGGDRIIFDIARQKLRPLLNTAPHSDYVPVTIDFDASVSESQYGKIIKYIFDFGEGKPLVEGDAIQRYRYTTAGAKEVKVTVVTEYGEKATITKTIILKDEQRRVMLTPSIDQVRVGGSVDWSSNGTVGQISETLWDFGDGSPISRDPNPTHTYNRAGTFTTTLRVIFIDGTEQKETRSFTVSD